jgi:diguanylate cyclase (GGDEF)-like protein/PAS domain S-box-containing protein
MYGLSAESLQSGTPLHEVVALRKKLGSFSGDPDDYAGDIIAAAQSGRTTRYLSHTPDGRAVEIVNHPLVEGGWVATHEDITSRWNAEKDREKAQTFLRTVVESIPTAILVKDIESRRYLMINKGFEDSHNVKAADVIGKTAAEVFGPDGGAKITAQEEQLLNSGDELEFFEQSLDVPGRGALLYSVKRIVIPGDDGAPRYLLGVIEDITERRRTEEHIAHLAHFDSLTDLPNRVSLRKTLDDELSRLRRGEVLAVHYLDLDDFKSVNDTLGHLVGDDLLELFAQRLKELVREGDTVARLGGDEFAVVQAGLADPGDAGLLAQRIIDAVKAPFALSGANLVTGVSIGIAVAPGDGRDSEQLLKFADLALYRAKHDGRGTYRFFERDMDARIKARRAVELDLRRAIENDELELHYQPILDLDRDEISCCEALLRWCHPTRGYIAPAEFIPIAEETGLIASLGEWVLRRACADAVHWPDHIRVAVNVSPVQFRSDVVALVVLSALATSGLRPERLEIEITEAVLLQRSEATLGNLHQLRKLGVRIVMDDFGTGYSSLGYLSSFPFDKIKIDRSFVQALAADAATPRRQDNAALTIVRAIIGIGRDLRITTTAEGVEDERQCALLRDLGCHEIQGYVFCRPLPLPRLHEFLARGFRRRAAAS